MIDFLMHGLTQNGTGRISEKKAKYRKTQEISERWLPMYPYFQSQYRENK